MGALISQGVMYAVFSSDVCSTMDGKDSHCWMGRNGVAGAFNFCLIFGMVVASLHSYPPRNPVFQCWAGDFSYDSSVAGSSDEEVDPEESSNAASDNNESVSLFGTQSISRRSVAGSKKSGGSRGSKNAKLSRKGSKEAGHKSLRQNSTDEEEDKLSAAEEGNAKDDQKLELKDSSSLAGSIRASISNLLGKKNEKNKIDSSQTNTTEGSFKGVADRISKIETNVHCNKSKAIRAKPVTAGSKPATGGLANRSNLKPAMKPAMTKGVSGVVPLTNSDAPVTSQTAPGLPKKTDPPRQRADAVPKAKESPSDNDDSDSIAFLRDLAAVTKLGKGGIRVKTTEKDHVLEMVDEYPAKAGEGLNAPHNIDGADLVKVRTEYYDQGSRTTKEVTHHDGSRTVVTTITSMVEDKTEEGVSSRTPIEEKKPRGHVSNKPGKFPAKTFDRELTPGSQHLGSKQPGRVSDSDRTTVSEKSSF